MPEQPPQDQPQPQPGTGQDWNEVSVHEIEKTLNSAADLAYELAGDVGVVADQPKYRDTSGLESIETALDVELKQLEHLVSRTKEQLNDDPPPADDATGRTAAVPDFMSEFLSDEPVTVLPDSRASAESTTSSGEYVSSPASGPVSPAVHSERRGAGSETAQKAGLIGVGSLGRRGTGKARKPESPRSEEPEKPASRASLSKSLGGPLFLLCDGAVRLLEVIDRPFAKLRPTTRRALSVTAIAAFCVCLAMFLLSLLFS